MFSIRRLLITEMRSFALPFLIVFYFTLVGADDLDIKIDEIFTKPPTTDNNLNSEVDTTLLTTLSQEVEEKIDDIFTSPSPTQTTLNSKTEAILNNLSTSSPPWSSTPSKEDIALVNSLFTTPPSNSSVESPYPETTSSTVSEDCVCVPFYQCKNGTSNTDGQGIFDIRISQESCSNREYVCCKPPASTSESDTSTKETIKTPSGCGYGKPNVIKPRILGEEDDVATFAEFPWMVAIIAESLVDNPYGITVYQCGGALIHPQAVLTAAHCVVGKNKKFKVRAGELDTQNTDEPLPHQQIDIKSIILHPQFYPGALYNDVAVLILETPFEIAENVNVICLPEQNYTTTDTRCLVSGWGKDEFGKKGKYQGLLKKIDVPVVERDTCQNRLRKTRLGRYFHLHRSFMCAGGEEGKDSCKGDGGSPLVCPIPDQEDRYYHAGIVAWGIGCGENKVPGVYVNVASFRDWIDEQMRHHNLDCKSYKY